MVYIIWMVGQYPIEPLSGSEHSSNAGLLLHHGENAGPIHAEGDGLRRAVINGAHGPRRRRGAERGLSRHPSLLDVERRTRAPFARRAAPALGALKPRELPGGQPLGHAGDLQVTSARHTASFVSPRRDSRAGRHSKCGGP